jgi:hypothetical protein
MNAKSTSCQECRDNTISGKSDWHVKRPDFGYNSAGSESVKVIFCASLVFGFGLAHASDLLSLGKTQDGESEAFVDRATILVVGNVRSAVFQYVPSHHIDKLGKEWIVRSEQFSEYDCKNDAVHAVKLIIYLEGGGNHTRFYPTAWAPVTAPWDHVALGYLCSWQGH